MRKLLDRIRDGGDGGYCGCRPAFDGETLRVDASDCEGAGKLTESEDCRATVVDALTERDAERVVTRTDGVERAYEDRAAALLVAAGRFAERIAFRDERLADCARRDPLRASRDADARGPQISGVAAETGLAAVAQSAESYETALRPYVGPTVAGARVAARPPADGRLLDTRTLDTGSDARIYERPGAGRTYHLLPASWRLDADARATLAAAYRLLATGGVDGEDRAPGRAVRRVADEDDPVAELTEILEKHTRGFGAVSDLLSDPAVSDVFVSGSSTVTFVSVTLPVFSTTSW